MADLFDARFWDRLKLITDIGRLITHQEAKNLGKHPEVLKAMVETMRNHSAFMLVKGLFLSPRKQIVRVREWNIKRGWGLNDENFAEAEHNIPKRPKGNLVAVTLVPYLEDEEKGHKGVERTLQALWDVAACEWRDSDGYDHTDPDRLRLLKGIEHTPGLRWEVIDLGTNRNQKPIDVRNAKTSPNAGILASAALHLNWIRAMDGDNVPYVSIPGYEVYMAKDVFDPDKKSWCGVLNLDFYRDDRTIRLFEGWNDNVGSEWAVPTFVE